MFTRRAIGKLILGGTATTAGLVGAVSAKDEGTQRSIKFWSNIFPIYAHYRWILFLSRDIGWMRNEQANEIYEQLHNKYTDQVRDLTYEMTGAVLDLLVSLNN